MRYQRAARRPAARSPPPAAPQAGVLLCAQRYERMLHSIITSKSEYVKLYIAISLIKMIARRC
ncbi:hypothetical protein RR46_02386 [Papilio xuthus]|uniref:Uncharacterized protein n=1 Tax=Papilio xuthus TaxID=66420 RepID=A0A194Q2E4_PAPXU|nr:hypothetical protein RR46_02386 [Papilio xuthus]